MGGLTLLLGGARSGKSSLAVEMGRRAGEPVAYIATAAALDVDMEQRIERHRHERPPSWTTIEEQIDLIDAIDTATAGGAETTIIDCLTLWSTNLLLTGRTDDDIVELAELTARHAATAAPHVVAISNEVGLGVHPDTDLGRRYRDLHGWVNQTWARQADTSLLLVAGRAVRLDDPWSHLPTRHNDGST